METPQEDGERNIQYPNRLVRVQRHIDARVGEDAHDRRVISLALYVDDNIIACSSDNFVSCGFQEGLWQHIRRTRHGPGVAAARHDSGAGPQHLHRQDLPAAVLVGHVGALEHGGLQANGLAYIGRHLERLCGWGVIVKAASWVGAMPKLDWELALRLSQHTAKHHHGGKPSE
jgi:hypothetical protein